MMSRNSGPLDRARVYAAATSLRDIGTAEEVRSRVDRYADLKVDIIKFHIFGRADRHDASSLRSRSSTRPTSEDSEPRHTCSI